MLAQGNALGKLAAAKSALKGHLSRQSPNRIFSLLDEIDQTEFSGRIMSIDKSLKRKNTLSRQRSVLTRTERIKTLQDQEKWVDGRSPFGLPKVRVQKIVLKKVKKEKAAEGEAAEGAAAPAAGAAKK